MQRIVRRFAPNLKIEDLVMEIHKSCKQPVLELEILELASTGLKLA